MKKILGFLAGFAVLAFIGLAVAQNTSNYMEQGGTKWVVGGELDIASGGTFKIGSTAVSSTAAELDQCNVETHFSDIGTASSAYATSPCTGTLSKVYVIIWGTLANGTADMSVYANGILVSPASFLIASGSTAETIDAYTRTAGGVITAGQALRITSDGGGDSTVAATVTFVIDR